MRIFPLLTLGCAPSVVAGKVRVLPEVWGSIYARWDPHVWIWICSYLCLSMCTTNFTLYFYTIILYCCVSSAAFTVFPSCSRMTLWINLPLAVFSAWALSPYTLWFSCPGQSSGCVSPWRELSPFRQWLRLLGWLSLNGAVILAPPESPFLSF